MAKDSVYTDGVIAVKETQLLGDKLIKLCETNTEEAFRVVTESGFGKGAEVLSAYDYEKLLEADERDIDAFIAEYAPSRTEAEYLLAPRDFHNAKSLIKAHRLGISADKMLAPQGLIPVEELERRIGEGNFESLGKELNQACSEAYSVSEEERDLSGAQIGALFDRALYKRLAAVCARNGTLKKLLAAKADMTNILTLLRSESFERAESDFLEGGILSGNRLKKICGEDGEKAVNALSDTGYKEFLKLCLDAKAQGLPYTQAERMRDNYDTLYFSERKYQLKRSQPFLYYVFRRRAENANVRILFVCLLAGMDELSIKNRLRIF